jgi:hypothetical protein
MSAPKMPPEMPYAHYLTKEKLLVSKVAWWLANITITMA